MKKMKKNVTKQSKTCSATPQVKMEKCLLCSIDFLQATQDILEAHDLIVQKLVRKAREDLVWGKYV